MNEKRKKDVILMADAIDHQAPKTKDFPYAPEMEGIQRSTVNPNDISIADKILVTKKLEIPKCEIHPVNGRIYVISVAGTEMKTPGGLILPPSFKVKKNEDVEGIRRYFVVDWDKSDDMPSYIKDKLCVAIEVNPFIPQDAEGFSLPRVLDWNTGVIFEVLHYTELAGISRVKPKEVE